MFNGILIAYALKRYLCLSDHKQNHNSKKVYHFNEISENRLSG